MSVSEVRGGNGGKRGGSCYICTWSLTSTSSTSLGAAITLPTYLRMSGESCRIVRREGEGRGEEGRGTNEQSHH